MPQYHFHMHQHDDQNLEEEVEARDIDDARAKAILAIRDVLSGDLRRGVMFLNDWLEITDEQGLARSIIPFGDAVVIVR